MSTRFSRSGMAASLLIVAVTAFAADTTYHRVVDGVAVYFGIMPAEVVRGHPRWHPEGTMHGGVEVGASHLTVAVFQDKNGERIIDAKISAHITGEGGLDLRKKLEPMLIAGSRSYGNYFSLPGAGPYRIEISIQLPRASRTINAEFTWARS